MDEGKPTRPNKVGEAVDILFALTSFAFYAELTANGRSASAAWLIQNLTTEVVKHRQ